MHQIDGLYMLSMPSDEDLEPPKSGDDKLTLNLTPMGRVRVSGDNIINEDDNPEVQEYLDNTFLKHGYEEEGVMIDVRVPMANGQKGFNYAFFDTLATLDVWYEKIG
jgi:hypothetical protein